MKSRLERLEEIALVLENEGAFHSCYTRRAPSETFGTRRMLIGDFMYKLYRRSGNYVMNSCTVEDRDQLRRYFDERWSIPQDEANKYAHDPTIWSHLQPPQPKESSMPVLFSTPDLQLKEPQAMTIKITTKTFANDMDVSKMSNAQIYDLIKQQEADIAGLEAIKAKPKKLLAEIAERQAGIDALVAYLDSQEK